MYNSINPINITYRNPRQGYASQTSDAQNQEQQSPVSYEQGSSGNSRQFPNGAKVAIDYTKNRINISQIVTDFKSTILAINAPDDISQEVSSYLSLVEKESQKANPSRDIIVSNLKNASKISDEYIAKSLNKPSRVVEGWIDALFMQNIELKADPTHINPDFQLDIPDKKKQKSKESAAPVEHENIQDKFEQVQPFAREVEAQDVLSVMPESQSETKNQTEQYALPDFVVRREPQISAQPVIEEVEEDDFTPVSAIEQAQVLTESEPVSVFLEQQEQIETVAVEDTKPKKPQYVTTEHDRVISKSLKEAKTLLTLEDDPAAALETLNDALGEVTPETNKNLRAALHFERGKIFDDYDYVNYALRDFYEATKCDDNNLKLQAHVKMARIYDDYVEFEPAMEHYQDAVAYGGEADNLRAQAKILSEMASVYAGRFDVENTQMLTELSVEAAKESNSSVLLSQTYSSAAKNYEYIGEDAMALENYKNAVKAINSFSPDLETYEILAQNYEDAADVMDRLGNAAKSESLLSKARLYRQRILLEQMSEAV